jgi:hypothetical protein
MIRFAECGSVRSKSRSLRACSLILHSFVFGEQSAARIDQCVVSALPRRGGRQADMARRYRRLVRDMSRRRGRELSEAVVSRFHEFPSASDCTRRGLVVVNNPADGRQASICDSVGHSVSKRIVNLICPTP